MTWQSFGVYEDVIKVHKKQNVLKILADIINEGLEEGGRIAETEWHHQIIKMSYGSFEGGLSFSPLADPEQVVDVAEVKFYEDGVTVNWFESWGD